jgi:hypothetical protein
MGSDATAGITEQDIANYLINTPEFFSRQAELLANVQLSHPHGQRTVSLQERQAEMLREKIKALERKFIEMFRNGQENVAIADRLHRWTCQLMLTRNAAALPQVLLDELRDQFLIPQTGLRLWGVDAAYAGLPFAQSVGDDTKTFAASLTEPYCGVNSGFEAVQWLDEVHQIKSIALIPLTQGLPAQTFGMLVLGSPDPIRYTADMGTEFLSRIGEIASASLSRLLPAA